MICPACRSHSPAGKRFCGDCGAALSAAEPASGRAPDAAERRQLTVIFCDLVGSTALSGRLDPEDMRGVIGAYHRAVADTATAFGGFVAKYMGDGVLVLFGYPRAREGDAEQAVRMGLALLDAVAGVGGVHPLQIRVGIATGLTVVGDLIGSGSSQEQAVVGGPPNLAARLQAAALPDTVLIADGTRRLVGSLFDLAELPPQVFKGFPGETRVWRVIREARAIGRFEALRSGGTPFMGRDAEMEALRRHWSHAKAGRGRAVLISGEAGIGKSRLAATFQEIVARERPILLRFDCSPHYASSALHPVIGNLQRAARSEAADNPQGRYGRLATAMRPARPSPEELRLVAELVGALPEPDETAGSPTPQARKEAVLAVLFRQVEALARRRPVLMIWEDAHWIDPTSLELLTDLVERAGPWPILILVTARPSFTASWTEHTHARVIALGRLEQHEVDALIQVVAGQHLLAGEVVAEIAARTDGVPLFVEELTKTVMENGVSSDSQRARVPVSLQAALMSRLDRLGPARETAQLGAVIGREFTEPLLATIAGAGPAELARSLMQLEEAELIAGRGEGPDRTYTFKHALVQDAAYESLLKARRQVLHARLAEALEAQDEVGDQRPELLAFHYGLGGRPNDAAGHYLAAARLALRRSASQEAISHLETALDLRPRPELQLELHSSLAEAYMLAQGYSSTQAGESVDSALRLHGELGIRPHVGLLEKHWLFSIVAAKFATARVAAEEILNRAREDDRLLMLGRYMKAHCHLTQGEYDEADRSFGLAARALHVPEQVVAFAGLAVPVATRSWHATVLLARGYPEQAVRISDEAIALARGLDQPFTLTFALAMASRRSRWARDYRAAEIALDEVDELVAEHGFEFYRATTEMSRGGLMAHRGEPAGLDMIEEGLTHFERTGAQRTMFRGLFAEACDAAGEPGRGLAAIADALRSAEAIGDREWLAEFHRIKGRLLVQTGAAREAENCFGSALDLARRQGARFWELRAARDLAVLWRGEGRHAEARDVLRPVLAWFTEGLETPDIREAAALIASPG